jgi:hypothetical protein
MAKGSTAKGSAAMNAAWERFDAGDIASARRLARELLGAATAPSPHDAQEAKDLLERTRLPRQVLVIGAVALVLLVLLWLLASARGGVVR